MTSISMFPGQGGAEPSPAPSRRGAPSSSPSRASSSFRVGDPSPPPSPPPPGPAAPTEPGEPGAGRPPSRARPRRVAVDARAVLCALCLASICTPVTDQPAPSPAPKSPTDPEDSSGAAVAAARAEVERLTTQLAALEQQLADLSASFVPPPCHLSPIPSTRATHAASLPRVYGWLRVGTARVLVLCLIDSGAYTSFITSSLAARYPSAWSRPVSDRPHEVVLASGKRCPTEGSFSADLSLGSLTEATSFTVFSVGCGANIILGYDWLKAHDLQFLYDDSQISVRPAGDRSGKRVRADLATAADPAAAAAASLMRPNEVRSLLAALGWDTSTPLVSPLKWKWPGRRGRRAAALADHAFVMASLSSLASADVTLPDGTELFVGYFALVAPDKPAVPDSEDPEFAALAEEYADVFELPKGLPPSRGRDYELVIDTGDAPMPKSRPLKRFSQGELDECRRQVAYLLEMGWIQPSRASHAASVVFASKSDGTWRFCKDFRGLNQLTRKSCEPLPHIDQLID